MTGNGAARGCGTATVRAPPPPAAPPFPMAINTMHDRTHLEQSQTGCSSAKTPDAHQSRSRPAGLAGGRHENVEHGTTEKGLDVSDLNPKVKP